MAVQYCLEEEEVWKCPKHPSKRRRNGICPICLRDRLVSLCPYCANVRPCSCASSTASSSSSSSSSSEPSFRRSRSVALPFLRSRNADPTSVSRTPSFMSILRRSTTKRSSEAVREKSAGENRDRNPNDVNFDCNNRIDDFARMITRSRSVSAAAAATATGFRRPGVTSTPSKGKFWYFPSPMKIFRSSKTPKINGQDHSLFSRR